MLLSLRCRTKLLLLTIIPLIAITSIITLVFYRGEVANLHEELNDYRQELISMRQAELQANVRMGMTAIQSLYDSDKNGENKAKAQQILQSMRFSDDGYFYGYNSKGVVILHGMTPSLLGKNLYSMRDKNGLAVIEKLIKSAKQGDGFLTFSWDKPSTHQSTQKLSFQSYLPQWDWIIGTGVYIDDIDQQVLQHQASREAQLYEQMWYACGLSVLGLIMTILIVSVLIARGVAPLKHLAHSLLDVASGEGDLTARLNVESNDEIGDAARSFNLFMDKSQNMIKKVSMSKSDIINAVHQLNQHNELANKHMSQHSLETDNVVTAVTEMSSTAKEVAKNTNTTAQSIEAANQQIANAQREVNEAIDGIGNLVNEVNETSIAIEELKEQAAGITHVLSVIGDIAEQTNLLALNAAIEAARAGDQGRGFAVVADEVRKLAGRTQTSTQEVNDMLNALNSGVEKAVTRMQISQKRGEQTSQDSAKISRNLDGVAEAVNAIQEMGIQTASAAEEQSLVAEEINQNLVQIQQIVTDLGSGIEQSVTVGHQLSKSGDEMAYLVEQFKVA